MPGLLFKYPYVTTVFSPAIKAPSKSLLSYAKLLRHFVASGKCTVYSEPSDIKKLSTLSQQPIPAIVTPGGPGGPCNPGGPISPRSPRSPIVPTGP